MRYLFIFIALFVCLETNAACLNTASKEHTYTHPGPISAIDCSGENLQTTQAYLRTSATANDVVIAAKLNESGKNLAKQEHQTRAANAAKLLLLLFYSVGSPTGS